MSKYPVDKKTPKQRWQDAGKRKTSGSFFLSAFLVVFLVFFIFVGLAKRIDVSKFFSSGDKVKNPNSLVALGTNPATFAVFEKDSNKIYIFKLDPNFHLVVGNGKTPIETLNKISKDKSGKELARIMSIAFRANIDNYVVFGKEKNANLETLQDLFKNFASFSTPFKIIINKAGLADTNLTRLNLIGLWWQAKSIGIKDINLVDLSSFSEGIISKNGSTVLGADENQLNREVAKYTEIPEVLTEHKDVTIVNATSVDSVASLSAGFVNSIGADVADVESQKNTLKKSLIVVRGDLPKTAKYLASIFNCDIKRLPQDPNQPQITLVVGEDFANFYFQ